MSKQHTLALLTDEQEPPSPRGDILSDQEVLAPWYAHKLDYIRLIFQHDSRVYKYSIRVLILLLMLFIGIVCSLVISYYQSENRYSRCMCVIDGCRFHDFDSNILHITFILDQSGFSADMVSSKRCPDITEARLLCWLDDDYISNRGINRLIENRDDSSFIDEKENLVLFEQPSRAKIHAAIVFFALIVVVIAGVVGMFITARYCLKIESPARSPTFVEIAKML